MFGHTSLCRHRIAFLAILFFIQGFFSQFVRAESDRIVLDKEYASFAMNPATGEIAAIHAESSDAVLFKLDAAKAEKQEPAAKLRVGSKPVSIVYKKYKDKEVFAV